MVGFFGDILKSLDAIASADRGPSRPERSKDDFGGRIKRRTYATGATIADWDDSRQAILLIVSGWVASGKALTSGARTVLDLSLPGDIVTIGTTEWAREIITALSPVTIIELPGPSYKTLLHYPEPVSEAVLKGMARRYARLAEHLVNIGRRGAVERTAHLFVELAHRVNVREKDGVRRFSCPLTQADLADALGLTAVHVNRVLKELREAGYVSFRGGVVEITDFEGLVQLAQFDASYLALRAR
ncbi:Crp/Fnr family transcriptional regulator [Nitratireductor sp. GCM10026969]|uniref:Crp/Fnr family transcriptional regulator n=1 Tax=Nitratireductor sp. GCM10026969 TaxID=3252645 RepID=UPI00360AF67E